MAGKSKTVEQAIAARYVCPNMVILQVVEVGSGCSSFYSCFPEGRDLFDREKSGVGEIVGAQCTRRKRFVMRSCLPFDWPDEALLRGYKCPRGSRAEERIRAIARG